MSTSMNTACMGNFACYSNAGDICKSMGNAFSGMVNQTNAALDQGAKIYAGLLGDYLHRIPKSEICTYGYSGNISNAIAEFADQCANSLSKTIPLQASCKFHGWSPPRQQAHYKACYSASGTGGEQAMMENECAAHCREAMSSPDKATRMTCKPPPKCSTSSGPGVVVDAEGAFVGFCERPMPEWPGVFPNPFDPIGPLWNPPTVRWTPPKIREVWGDAFVTDVWIDVIKKVNPVVFSNDPWESYVPGAGRIDTASFPPVGTYLTGNCRISSRSNILQLVGDRSGSLQGLKLASLARVSSFRSCDTGLSSGTATKLSNTGGYDGNVGNSPGNPVKKPARKPPSGTATTLTNTGGYDGNVGNSPGKPTVRIPSGGAVSNPMDRLGVGNNSLNTVSGNQGGSTGTRLRPGTPGAKPTTIGPATATKPPTIIVPAAPPAAPKPAPASAPSALEEYGGMGTRVPTGTPVK